MYLFHIKPIPPEKAGDDIISVYNDINQTLYLNSVPLVFQYSANFPQYFFYLWERVR